MLKIILLSFIGAFISMLITTIWHSSKLFGKVRMDYHAKQALSFEEHINKIQEKKPELMKIYLIQFLFSFITSFFLAVVMKGGYGFIYSKYLFIFIGLVWISFTVPAIGTDVLWSDAKGKIAFKKFLSEIFSSLLTFIVIIYVYILIL
ncbi:MAG: DUF1761 domain-containing protein [Candidatus Pacebacteria bacterium]|nr:DUF1761 domain-containing protein [Candidatus Paceibacterota bacterium]